MAFAALIAPLVLSGSRKSDGTANATGTVYFYRPGTLTPVTVYADANAETQVSAPLILDNGGRVNFNTYPEGVFSTQPVRLLIQDTDGNTVSDVNFIPATAGNVGVDSDEWPDMTTQAEVNAAIAASVGGINGEYQESPGADPRPIQDKFREQGVWVTDFGAVGDGIADDTTAIQSTVNRAIDLGGAVVHFPPGTFVISGVITLTSATGVRIIGAGQGNTLIRQTNNTAGIFAFATASTDCSVENLSIIHVTTSSSAAISFTAAAVRPVVSNVKVTDGDFSVGLSITGLATTSAKVTDSYIAGITTGIGLTDVARAIITGTQINTAAGGGDQSVLYAGTTTNVNITNCVFFAQTGVQFGTATGTEFVIAGCPTLASNTGTQPIDMSGLSVDPILYQWGNRIEGRAYLAAVGNTLSILIQNGYAPILVASSGGAGTMTVAAPFPTPSIASTSPAVFLDVIYKNASGGNVTWSHAAAFVVSTAIPITDGHTINVRWRWDRTTSKWRQCSLVDTVT